MSLKTWKAEFYSTEADSPEAMADPLGHSLRKWEGLLPENLERHGVAFTGLSVRGTTAVDSDPWFYFDDQTCSLCKAHGALCTDCPVDEAGENCNDRGSPFLHSRGGDPIPMIDLLRRLKENAK